MERESQPELRKTSPQNGEPGSWESLRLEQLRATFKRDFLQNDGIRIEDYLAQVPTSLRSLALRELLAIELKLRIDSGLFVGVDDYLNRFSSEPELIEFMLERVSALEQEEDSADSSQPTVVQQPTETGVASEDIAPIDLLAEFGRYRVLRELGQGAMGAVFLAHDTQLDRRVALKIPKFSGEEASLLLKRFYREARAAAKLRHPNICPVFDVGEISGRHYISMAYIDGRPLDEVIASGSLLTERRVAELVRKLALGLVEAHALGIIHRDLKPANIMLDAKGEPVVMDFGLARPEETEEQRVTHGAVIIGTPAYMSPEQIEGEQSQVGPQSDVYSLGVVMYELLAGRVPFAGTLMSILKQVASDAPQLPSAYRADLDPRLEAICLKMMAKRVSDRYRSMNEVAETLADFLRTTLPNPRHLPVARRLDENAVSATYHANVAIEVASRATQDLKNTIVGDLKLPTLREPPAPSIAKRLKQQDRGLHRHTALALAAGAAGAAVLLFSVWLWFRSGSTQVKVLIDDPALVVSVSGEKVKFSESGKSIRLKPGEHQFIVERDGAAVETNTFTVRKTARNVLQVSLARDKVAVLLDGKKSSKIEVAQRAPNPEAWQGWPKDAPPPAIAPFDARQARLHQESWAKYLKVPTEYTNSVGMRFQLIPPGEFYMGSAQSEVDEVLGSVDNLGWVDHIKSQAPRHRVILTRPFYLAMHEVTQAQYEIVMRKNPAHFSQSGTGKDLVQGFDTASFPVESVNWHQAVEFCEELSKREGISSTGEKSLGAGASALSAAYRLPTEAEWEFACRAGTTTRFWTGNQHQSLNQAAWIKANAGGRTHAVGMLSPNPFNLYDVHGNVWEWVHDCWEAGYYKQFQTVAASNPTGPPLDNDTRIFRGGSWVHVAVIGRSAHRDKWSPAGAGWDIGFRPLLSLEAVKAKSKNPATGGALVGASQAASVPDPVFDPEDAIRLEFDGQDDYVLLPNLTIPEGPVTVETRILGTAGRGSVEVVARGVGIRQLQTIYFHDSQVGTVFGWHDADGFALSRFPNALVGRIVHLAAQWNGQLFHFYVEGKKVATAKAWREDWIHKPEDNTSSLGAEYSRPRGYNRQIPWLHFRGQMAEARFSGIARYQGDFRPEIRLAADEHTLALYHFDEGEGERLVDSSGHNHHGTIFGARWVRPKEAPRGTNSTGNGGPKETPPPAIVPFDALQAQKHQEVWARHLGVPVEFTNSIGMKFRLIPATSNTKPFYLGVYEATQSQYETVLGENPSYFCGSGEGGEFVKIFDTAQFPVENITIADALRFCARLSARDAERQEKRSYRLPTQAEWSVACAAGVDGPFHTGKSISTEQANFNGLGPDGNAPKKGFLGRTTTVGSYPPNAFGMFDMLGNVSEYCTSPPLLRGGSWNHFEDGVRNGSSYPHHPSNRGKLDGFRVALPIDSTLSTGKPQAP